MRVIGKIKSEDLEGLYVEEFRQIIFLQEAHAKKRNLQAIDAPRSPKSAKTFNCRKHGYGGRITSRCVSLSAI